MAAMVPAVTLSTRLARGRLGATPADHGPAGRRELALVLEQARGNLAAVGNELVAKPLRIALAGILILHSNIILSLIHI